MKTENNLTNKAMFFVNYFQQRVIRCLNEPEVNPVATWTLNNPTKGEFLQLTPLSGITDEDAIHVARLAHQLNVKFEIERVDERLIHLTWVDSVNIEHHISINELGCINTNWHFLDTEQDSSQSFKVNIGEVQTSSRLPIPYIAITDYLRSKGYAIGWRDLSVDDLVNYGWVKLKEAK